jgi:hypothetical protein
VAQSVTDVQLMADTIVGIDPENLESEFQYGAQPLIEVEATLPGMDRPVPVGLGTAYDVGGNPRRWDLRSAYAGAADPANPDSPFDAELRLRAEIREDDPMSASPAAVSVIRPDLADLAALAPLRLPDAPVVTPPPMGMIAASTLDVTFSDVIGNASGLALDGRGIYAVTLTEDLAGLPGRKWVLWRRDAVGAAPVTVRFPHLFPDPTPIQTMATTDVDVTAYAWETFPLFDPMDAEPDLLLWSDIARESEIVSRSATLSFTLQ